MKEELTTKEIQYPFRPVIMPGKKGNHAWKEVVVSAILYEAGYSHLFDGSYFDVQWFSDSDATIFIESTSNDGHYASRVESFQLTDAGEFIKRFIARA